MLVDLASGDTLYLRLIVIRRWRPRAAEGRAVGILGGGLPPVVATAGGDGVRPRTPSKEPRPRGSERAWEDGQDPHVVEYVTRRLGAQEQWVRGETSGARGSRSGDLGELSSLARGNGPRRTFAVVATATPTRATAWCKTTDPALDGHVPSAAGSIGMQHTVAAHPSQASSMSFPDPETPQQNVSGTKPFCRELCAAVSRSSGDRGLGNPTRTLQHLPPCVRHRSPK
ncbi:hypothetical protein HPB47_020191 [Ixodes persulcatus]|uniref:Uncharacterized protein n=1 Tax=Ixodes persulcatus TaxID=34615 RepID=A0AC60QIC2_IXOPE|nr:hypothetical protein HPB47_020191 [Ixodes persulcatus]